MDCEGTWNGLVGCHYVSFGCIRSSSADTIHQLIIHHHPLLSSPHNPSTVPARAPYGWPSKVGTYCVGAEIEGCHVSLLGEKADCHLFHQPPVPVPTIRYLITSRVKQFGFLITSASEGFVLVHPSSCSSKTPFNRARFVFRRSIPRLSIRTVERDLPARKTDISTPRIRRC